MDLKDGLCAKCAPMFQSKEWGSHHLTMESLTLAASAGCHICKYLLPWLLEKAKVPENCIVEPTTYRVYAAADTRESTQILIDTHIINDEGAELECYGFQAIPQTKITSNITETPRTEVPSLPKCIEIAQYWMSNCLESHDKCRQSYKQRPNNVYPTRLIDVGSTDLRLVNTNEVKLSGPYATLSYCWGSDTDYLLLSPSNLPRLSTGFALSELPMAFQEAVEIARSLSMQYIWVDALCIMQSGEESILDWHREAPMMQSVYSNSAVNICLSSISNPGQSCVSRICSETIPTPFTLTTTGIFCDESDDNLVVGELPCVILHQEYYHTTIYNQPLGWRAWGLQERILPARNLSFGQAEIFWECLEQKGACTSFPTGIPSSLHRIYRPPMNSIRDINGQEEDSHHILWTSILKDYTSRNLTYPKKDKLMAIMAIATQIVLQTGDVYIEGHFRSMLPFSLNWYGEPYLSQKYRSKHPIRKKIAPFDQGQGISNPPSWSWASMDGEIFQHYYYPGSPGLKTCVAVRQDYNTLLVMNKEQQLLQKYTRLYLGVFCAEIQRKESFYNLSRDQRRLDRESITFDDPDFIVDDGSEFSLAIISKDKHMMQWSGLVLKKIMIQGEVVFYRVGHFRYSNMSGCPCREDDWLAMCDCWESIMGEIFDTERRSIIVV